MKHIHLLEVDSTNNYLKKLLEENEELEEWTYVTAYEQSSGRGQRGNGWESAPGKNLSLSLLLRPKVQNDCTPFDLNIVTSLSLYDLLSSYLHNKQELKVKWPNDILINQCKIAGILTENEWLGNQWAYSIVGIGLNLFQKEFGGYHPKATSLALECDIQEPSDYTSWHHPLAEKLVQLIMQRLKQLYSSPQEIRQEYLTHLYRFQEKATFATPNQELFEGTIIGVEPNGLVNIQVGDNVRRFAFKEVIFK